MDILHKKKLGFEKIHLSKSKIKSDQTATITVNVKNFKEKVDDISVIVKTEDASSQYLTIKPPSIRLPSLVFPDSNTGNHEFTINPINIPVHKMIFKITVEVYTDNAKKLMLNKEFDLTVTKKDH
ncbi:MAG TPA: hypothetical protein VLT10_00515 [Verrucomicrobiae bacterium]|nr:hypothetical protein [Verrucomicrobiae bacterium]